MKVHLMTKTALIFSALVLAAVIGISAALIGVWNDKKALDQVISKNVLDISIAAELDIALLRQRGLVANYIFSGGDINWLVELGKFEPLFRSRLQRVLEASETEGERAVLGKVTVAFNKYDAKRDEIIMLYDSGDVDQAREVYLTELNALYAEVAQLCDAVVDLNNQEIQAVLARNTLQVRRTTALMTTIVILIVILTAGMIWVLVTRYFAPLKRMTEEMRDFSQTETFESNVRDTADPEAVHQYLQALMTEISETRSDLAQSRRELQHSERLAAIGKVVAHIAHEMKNGLAIVGGFARAIQKRPDRVEQTREDSEVIAQEVSRMEKMLNDVMKYSRPVRLQPVRQPLNPVIEDVLVALSEQIPGQVSLQIHLHPDTPEVAFDKDPLKQVLINLVKNAVEALGEGGEVIIRTQPSGDGAVITIADNGPGIPEEVKARIYEPFFTTKAKGNGLGLAICKQIISEHGGIIEVESASGKGTVFNITFGAAKKLIEAAD